MTKSCLRLTIAAMTGALIGINAAVAEDSEIIFLHPADPVQSQSAPATSNAFDLAVPMIDRPDAHPSYGPTPADASADPVEMEQMIEMDHSQHQMPAEDDDSPNENSK